VDFICLLSEYPGLDEKIDAETFSLQGGGPVPTALVTMAHFGAKTSYIGVVGDDEDGKFLLYEFSHAGVDTSATIIDKNGITNRAFIWVDKKSGKKSIVLTQDRSSSPLIADEVSRRHLMSTKYMHIDGRETQAVFPAVEFARENGVEVILDAGSPRDRMDELLGLVDYPVVSEAFCRNYFGKGSYQNYLGILKDRGARYAVITCGERGSYAIDDGEIYHQPAFNVSVMDTTGAGDVFHGAFIYGLIQGWQLKEIMRFSAAAAALKCTKIGGRSGIPDLTMVNKLLSQKEKNE
jgi:ribokinase